MDTDRIAGSAKDFAGKVESAAGDIAGDAETQASGRGGDALALRRLKGDNSAADRATDLVAPELAASIGVERIEIAAQIAEEDNAAGCRYYSALNGIIGLRAPTPFSLVRVDGVEPSRPIEHGIRLAPHVVRIDRILGRPGRVFRRLFGNLDGIDPYGCAPLNLTDHDEIVLRVVCRPVPFGTADGAGAEMHALLW